MDIRKATDQYIFDTYGRYPLTIKRAKGSWVWDEKGKKYLDFFSGLAVSGIGHGLPSVISAINKQAKQLIHTSNYYYTEPGAKLAEQLCKLSFADKVFFSNSGSEANECAIKLVRRFGYRSGGRFEIIVFKNSFHGRTLGALAATGQPKFHEGFGPLPAGFMVAEYNNLSMVRSLVTPKTAAILIEPVQGEGGVTPARQEFLQGLRQIADEFNLLLIFDEVQCGLGRTGKMFAYQSFNVTPDVMTLAKGLGGGMPISATLAKADVAALIGRGDHGTTFGANPVCCAAALAVLKLLTPALFKRVTSQSQLIMKELHSMLDGHIQVKQIRGYGLMIGIELTIPGASFVDAARAKGLLINCTQGNVLRFLPPLAITPAETTFALRTLRSIFN